MQGQQSTSNKVEVEKKGGNKNESVDTMLEFNALQYNMWPDLTVCVDRTMKNSYFQTSIYGSENKTAYCILNTGSDFVLGRTSYLVFDLEVTHDPAITPLWGAAGSAYNLIKRITIMDRSGNELERIQDVNKLVNLQIRHTQSEKFLTSVGSCFLNPAEIAKKNCISSQLPVLCPIHYSGTKAGVDYPHNIQTLNLSKLSPGTTVIQPGLGYGLQSAYYQPEGNIGSGYGFPSSAEQKVRTNNTLSAVLTTPFTFTQNDAVNYDTLSFKEDVDVQKVFPVGTTCCFVKTSADYDPNELAMNIGQQFTVLGYAGNATEATRRVIYITKCNDKADEGLHKICILPLQSNLGSNITAMKPNQFSVSGRRWCLPLRFMSGLFDYDQLLPMQLMSGMRIEIEWATTSEAFRWAGLGMHNNALATSAKYTINNPRIVTDSCKMTDSILQELNTRSANNGLEIVYRTFFTTINTPRKDISELNIESRKAVSRCFGAYAAFYRNYSETTDQYARDRMETLPMNASEWQWRAGNLYFPNQMMKGKTAATKNYEGETISKEQSNKEKLVSMASETYMHTMRMFYKLKHTFEESYINVNNYTNALPGDSNVQGLEHYLPKTYAEVELDKDIITVLPTVQCNLYPLDLERSTIQDLSGLPLNNSRVLNFNWRKIQSVPVLHDIGKNPQNDAPAKLEYNLDDEKDWQDLYVPATWEKESEQFKNDSFDVNLFMQFLKVARVFIDNVQIEE